MLTFPFKPNGLFAQLITVFSLGVLKPSKSYLMSLAKYSTVFVFSFVLMLIVVYFNHPSEEQKNPNLDIQTKQSFFWWLTTRWTWVWVNSRSWLWTGMPGVLRFTGSQRVGHNWATEPNWTEHSTCTHTHCLASTLSCKLRKASCYDMTRKGHMVGPLGSEGRDLLTLWP